MRACLHLISGDLPVLLIHDWTEVSFRFRLFRIRTDVLQVTAAFMEEQYQIQFKGRTFPRRKLTRSVCVCLLRIAVRA